MKKILYVGYRDNSHSSAGGYDSIIGNPEADCLMGQNVPFGFIPVSTRGKILNVTFLDIISRFKRLKYAITHYFYGDTLVVPFLRLNRHKIVVTIHLNIEEERRCKSSFIKVLRSVDGIVVLSTNQKKMLKEKYNLDSVFIPHGFNRPEFEKVESILNKNKINVCVLGQNYRDYDTMEAIIKFCLERRSDICFHLIGQPQRIKEQFYNYCNVVVYPRIPDDKYFSVVNDCDYSFLPLTFATANNALLEAGFLGTASILPQIPGVEDYGAPSPLNLYYSNMAEAKKLFVSLKKRNKSLDLIRFCEENFLWDSVYYKLNDYYKTLMVK